VDCDYGAELPAKLAALIASGDPPDACAVLDAHYPSVVAKKLIQPIDSFVDFNDPFWGFFYHKNLQETLKYRGKSYLAVAWSGAWDLCWYNKKLFEEHGLKDPRQLYAEGNWNWDTMLEAAKALTADTNKDGTIDVYGVAIQNPSVFVSGTGFDFLSLGYETVENQLKRPEIARAMNFMSDLYNKHRVALPQMAGNADKAVQDGRAAMVLRYSRGEGAFAQGMKNGIIDFVPIPRDPMAKERYVGGMVVRYAAPTGAKTPGTAVAIAAAHSTLHFDYDNWKRDWLRWFNDFGSDEKDVRLYEFEWWNPNQKLILRYPGDSATASGRCTPPS